MNRRARRLLATSAAASLVLGLALAAPAPGAAAPLPGTGAGPATTAAAGAALRTDLAPGSYDLTLLTGDQVRLAVATDQTLRLTLTPVPRPDGSSPPLQWYTAGDRVYVVPADAAPDLAERRLDERLFDVEYLADHGYTDEATDGLPLIVEYADRMTPATALRAAGVAAAGAQPLASIDAAAVEVARAETTDFWASVSQAWSRAGTARTAPPAIEKVWLDGVSQLTLDESVPQIGAPQAWDAGLDGTGVTVAVLDTGVDFDHPDLAGRVIAGQNFTGDGDPIDGHGHGTHVATTIAGSGAASGGSYRGVAPGASLVIGKACDNNGFCTDSAAIAAMQWAAREQGADVINMSFGDCCTDGTDLLSQTVNQLSAETGALFVISAGNDGSGRSTVGTPGVADAALTVASVDKSGQMAGTSSRGPRLVDGAFKPEIAAPGVGIVAGRAAGTSMGMPVDEYYTSANGTSMAAPHVTGAAALLAQQRPGWDGSRLKTALIASAEDLGHPGYAQGAGRVDVARAISQQVEVSPAVVDFRFHPYPPVGDPLTRTVSYTNPTSTPVTLGLAGSLAGAGGAPVPAGALTLDTGTLTVPAGGTAAATITLTHTLLDSGDFTGQLVATDPTGLRLRTPIGITIGEQLHKLTVNLTARSCENGVHCDLGQSSFSYFRLRAYRLGEVPGAGDGSATTTGQPILVDLDPAAAARTGGDSSYRYEVTAGEGSLSVDLLLPEGHYAVRWEPLWLDLDNRKQYPWLWAPDVLVPGTSTVDLDANQAVKVSHHTPRPTGPDGLASSLGYHRLLPNGDVFGSGGAWAFGHGNFWSYPTGPLARGSFVLSHQDILEAPQVTMTLAGPEPVALTPIYSGYRPAGHPHPTVPVRFPEGTRTLPVVNVGAGTAADYAGVDAAGALVLTDHRPPGFCTIEPEVLAQALAAGAAGVLYNGGFCALPNLISDAPSFEDKPQLPYVSLPKREWDMLAEQVATESTSVTVTSTPVSPYAYVVRSYEEGVIPDSLEYHYPHDEVLTVQSSYHARKDSWFSYTRFMWRPETVVQVAPSYEFAVPIARTEYLAPVGADYRHERHVFSSGYAGSAPEFPGLQGGINRVDVFAEPGWVTERWNADPWAPGADVGLHRTDSPVLCAACREGDMFWPTLPIVTGDPAYYGSVVGFSIPTRFDPADFWGGLALYRNGQEVPRETFLGVLPVYPMPAEVADYRLVLDLTEDPVAAGRSHTEWEFRTGTGAGNPAAGNYACMLGGLTGADLPCQVQPLLFLRYAGLDTDLYHRVAAPGAHRFEVTAHRQPGTAAVPDVAGLKLWASYDGGDTWQEAKVLPRSDGRFEVKLIHPPADQRSSDSVTIRAEAWDTAGNRVTQTLPDAYWLVDSGPAGVH